MAQTVEVPCEKCGKAFLGMQPVADIVNHVNLTMLVWLHPRGDMCPHCHTRHVPLLADVSENGFVWKWRAVDAPPREEQPQILIPPAGSLIVP